MIENIENKINKKCYPAVAGWRSYISVFTTIDNYQSTVLNFKEYLIKNLNFIKSQDQQRFEELGFHLMQSRAIRIIVEYPELPNKIIPVQTKIFVSMHPKYPKNKTEFNSWLKRISCSISCLTPELAENLEIYDSLNDQILQRLISND